MMLAPMDNQMEKKLYLSYIKKKSGSWLPRMGSHVGESNPLPSLIDMTYLLVFPHPHGQEPHPRHQGPLKFCLTGLVQCICAW